MAESSATAKRRDGERGALLNSPVVGAPRQMTEKNPPRYGAQHRQDALWEGGNKVLPSHWRLFKGVGDRSQYLDDTIAMASWNRPLPGVRLDQPGSLVPGCEWHISPLGRSYFVNHNTRTTAWEKPTPERPPGSLTPECVIESGSQCIFSLAYLCTSCNILSTSNGGSIRQWTRDGESVGRPWNSDGGPASSIAMSPNESMVVSGSADGRIRLWNIRKGSMVGDPWEGHDTAVRCIDWSPNAQEIASGSEDGTIRRWNPDTGRQIAPPIEAGHGRVYAVRYSPQGDKFTSAGEDKVICVWSTDGELLIEINGHEHVVPSLCWSQDGANIFSASYDNTIRKWRLIDGKELVVFLGHSFAVDSLCLSPDGRHLVSAARDCSVRIWDLKTNQPVGDPLLHEDELLALAISRDGKYIASAGVDGRIYVWSLEAALKWQGNDDSVDASNARPDAKLKGRSTQPRHVHQTVQPINRGMAKYGNDFWGNDTNNAPRATPPANQSASTSRWHDFFSSLRFSTRPANVPQSIPLEPRRPNFNLFPGGSSIRTIEVAAGRKKNRIYVAPPSAAEVARAEAAAAMQHTNGNEAGSSTQASQPQAVLGTQVSQGRPTETMTHGSSGGTGEVSYEGVSCCGFFFGRRRPISHQS